MLHERLNADCLCMPTQPGPVLAAPHGLFLPQRTETALFAATAAVAARLRELYPRTRPTENSGVFNSFDYHITADGPKLIEINVNAGGAFLQPDIMAAVAPLPPGCPLPLRQPAQFDPAQTLLDAWHRHAEGRPLHRLAIIDDAPLDQPLYADMVAAQAALKRYGVTCEILDVTQLRYDGERLLGPYGQIDMVYNRWTDFTWEHPDSQPLRLAYAAGKALIAPNPDTWHAYADKARLIELAADRDRPAAILDAEPVTPDTAPDLWARRKQLVFKPLNGFASRGVYRGDKLTRGKWAQIVEGGYLAQALARPGLRTLPTAAGPRRFKADIRVWTHGDTPIHVAARLSSGQVTGLRGESEGFAPIFWVGDEAEGRHACA